MLVCIASPTVQMVRMTPNQELSCVFWDTTINGMYTCMYICVYILYVHTCMSRVGESLLPGLARPCLTGNLASFDPITSWNSNSVSEAFKPRV